MKKLLFFFLLIIHSVTTYAQTYQPLNIDGFNADVIANGVGTAESSTTNDVDGGGYCLKSIDWKLTATSTPQTTGFPLNGIVASNVSSTPGLTYQLQNYSNNNSIRIAYGGSSITSLVTGNVKAKKLFVLATTGSNYSNMQCTITFADNTTQEFLTNNVPDWFYGTNPPPAFIGFGRVMRSSNIIENPYDNPRLYQIELNIATANQNKEIQSITFGRTGSTIGVLNIFAVSAELDNSTNLCNTPSLISATPGSICGYGTAELTANYNTGTVRWFANATGGNALHTGNTFTTPVIDTTTSYWVSSTGVTQTTGTVGPTSPTTQGGTIAIQTIDWDVEFRVLNETVLNSIDIFPMTSGENGYIQVLTISGTLIQSYPFTTNVSGGTVAQTILLNHAFTPGDYKLDISLPINGIRSNISGANYPYTSPSINILRHGYDQTYYMGFYNWKYTNECVSPRTEVIATVTPAPPLTLTNTNVVLCAGQSQTVTIASGASNYDSYTITPTTGVTGNATTGWVFNPTVSTVYTLSAKQTTAALCKKDILIDVKVNPVPVIVTPLTSQYEICANEVQELNIVTSSTEVTIGVGTTFNSTEGAETAFCNRWPQSKQQYIYTAAELIASGVTAGKILSVAYNISTPGDGYSNTYYTIKMKHVTQDSFANDTFLVDDFTTVFGPSTYVHTNSGWQVINLTTPFIWDGVHNVVIELIHLGADLYDNAQTAYNTTTTNRAIVGQGYTAISNVSGTLSNKRLDVKLGFEIPVITWLPTTNLFTDVAATIPYASGQNLNKVYFKSTTAGSAINYTAHVATTDSCVVTSITSITVHETPAPIITETNYCITNTLADVEATFTPIGIVKWYDAVTAGTELPLTTALVNGTSYFASQTVSNCESVRTEVIVTIHNTPAPTAVDQTFCIAENATIADLVATGTNIKWYASTTSTSELNANVALVNGTSYFASQTVSNCESERTEVIVTIHNTPAPAAVDQEFCIAENATIANLVATGTNLKWYDSITSTTALNANVTLVNGTSYFASQTLNNCESERTEVIVTIHNTPAPTAINQTFCIAENATIAYLVATGTNIKWYASATSTTALNTNVSLVNGTSYFASQTVSNCESGRTEVIVTIHNTPASAAVDQEFCIAENATVADLVATGTNLKWYASITSTTALNTNVALVNGTSYFASQTLNNCESERTEVIVTIHSTPAPTAINQTFCIAENATIANLVATGTNIKWYASATSTSELNANVALVNGTSYFASQTLNNCESERTEVIVTIHSTPAPTAINQTFCIAENATIANLVATGTNIKWYASATSTSELNANVALVNGTSYFASQTVNNCESVDRTEVVVRIHNTPAPTAVDQDFCIAENATIADLVAIGQNIKWYDSITSTTALNANVALVNGTSYFASQTVSNCESERTEVIVTIHNTPAPTAINQTFCIAENATIANLVATGTNIKWYNSATSTDVLAATTVLTPGSYFATQTVNGCESVNRKEIQVTINTTPAPTAINQEYCIADNKTIADLVVNGTNIKWYSSATASNALAPSTVLTSGNYFATQTIDGCESLDRKEILVTIHNTPSPTANAHEFCMIDTKTVADLVANGNNIKWYNAVTSTEPLASTTVLSSGSYFATQTLNGCESVEREEVVVTFITIPAPTTSDQEFCIAENKTVADLVANGTNLKWYNSATSTNELPSSTILTSGNYFVSQTVNGCESVDRNEILVTIHNTPAPTATAIQEFCSNTNSRISDLEIQGSNIKWYASASSNTVLNTNTLLTNGTTYYATQKINGCESVERIPVTVQFQIAPNAPTGQSIQSFCGNATLADVEISGIAGAEFIWYNSAISTTELPITTALNNATYYVAQKVGECISNRKAITVSIINQQAPIVSPFEFCGSARVADLYILAPSGVTYKWYTSPSSTTALQPAEALVTGNYFVSRVQNNCESQRTMVPVTIKDLPNSPTGVSPQTFIEGSTLSQIVVQPANVIWHITEEDARTGTNPLAANLPLTNGTTYYAVTMGLNGCPSSPLPITVEVYLGNNEFDLEQLKYYPNPVDQKLNIAYFENILQIDVYDLLGRNVKTFYVNDKQLEIDLSELSAATYMIQLKTETKQQFIKIVKN